MRAVVDRCGSRRSIYGCGSCPRRRTRNQKARGWSYLPWSGYQSASRLQRVPWKKGCAAVVVTSPSTQVQLPGHTEDSELPKEREKDMDKRRSYLPWWSDWSPSRPRRLLPWSEGRVVGHLTCHASAAARPQHRQLHRHHCQLSSCPILSFLHNELETKGKAN